MFIDVQNVDREKEALMLSDQKRKSHPIRNTILVILGLAFVVGALNRNNSSSEASPSKKSDVETPAAIDDWKTLTDITQESVVQLLGTKRQSNYILSDGKISDHIVNTVVSDNSSKTGKVVTIRYKETDFLDENALVKIAVFTDMETMQALFENPKISRVNMVTIVPMVDRYGKSLDEEVVKLSYNRQTVNKIDWKGFNERVNIEPNLAIENADDSFVYPTILEKSKIKVGNQ